MYGNDAPESPETSEADQDVEDTAPEREPAQKDETHEQPVFPWAETIDCEKASRWENEREAENEFATNPAYNEVRHFVLERDGWKCTYPNCNARKQLHVHHVRYRSRGGSDAAWNLTVVCNFHHKLIHAERVAVRGHAPMALEWTPPELMRAVLERRRNRPSVWAGELDVREWLLERRAASA